jgi:hypothetical protein
MGILRHIMRDVIKPCLVDVSDRWWSRSPITLKIAFTSTQFTFRSKLPIGKTITIHWGDGTTTDVAGNDSSYVIKTSNYLVPGTYNFYITGDLIDLTAIRFSGNTFVSGSIDRWGLLINLTFMNINTTGMYGNIMSLAGLVNLTGLDIHATYIHGDVATLLYLINLNYLYWYGSYVTGNIAPLHTLASLLIIHGSSASTTFDDIVIWVAGGQLLFQDCEWTSTMVDNALNSMYNGSVTGATINLGGTNAARTSASDDAFTYLDANNTLTVNNPV